MTESVFATIWSWYHFCMKKFALAGYTAFFCSVFVVSADLIAIFSSTWSYEGSYFYGSPFASQNISTGEFLIAGILADVAVWGLLAFAVSWIMLRFWHLSRSLQLASLFALLSLIFTFYNTDITETYLASGWPLHVIDEGGIDAVALLVNGACVFLLASLALFLIHSIRPTTVSFPPAKKLLPWILLLAATFLGLAIFLPTSGGTAWENTIQNNFVLQGALLRDVMNVVTSTSAPSAALFISLAVLFGLRDKNLPLALLPLLASLLLVLSVPEMKEIISRIRPETSRGITADYALPAGHAAVSVIYLFLATLFYKRDRFVFFLAGFILIAFFSGWIRILLGLHWFGDLLAGWVWGVLVYLVSALMVIGCAKIIRILNESSL